MITNIFVKFVIIVVFIFSSYTHSQEDLITVIISYETQSCPSINFFRDQFNVIFPDFSACTSEFTWQFRPCATSTVQNKNLTCINGDRECQLDQIHSCVSEMNKNDYNKVGKFISCMMSSPDQLQSAETCVENNGMKWDDIQKCVSDGKGIEYCQKFSKEINNVWKIVNVPGIMLDQTYSVDVDNNAYADLQSALCKALDQRKMNCNYCEEVY